jgi:hypothetical protein
MRAAYGLRLMIDQVAILAAQTPVIEVLFGFFHGLLHLLFLQQSSLMHYLALWLYLSRVLSQNTQAVPELRWFATPVPDYTFISNTLDWTEHEVYPDDSPFGAEESLFPDHLKFAKDIS